MVSDSTVDINALNDFIKETKPAYMVPAVTMQIDKNSAEPEGKNKRLFLCLRKKQRRSLSLRMRFSRYYLTVSQRFWGIRILGLPQIFMRQV